MNRKYPNYFTSSPFLHHFQGYLSIFTSVVITLIVVPSTLIYLPLTLLYGKIISSDDAVDSKKNTKKTKNASTVTGSITAIVTLTCRSQMHLICGSPDNLAPLLCRTEFGSSPLFKLILFLERVNFYFTNRLLIDQIHSFFHQLGPNTYLHCRTCWLDDVIEAFIKERKIEESTKLNLVILGSGYDTRCYRCHLKERGVNMYEVDAAPTQKNKTKILYNLGVEGVDEVAFIPCDFESEDWFEKLTGVGFDSSLSTLFLWEGVTYYLNDDAVKETLRKIASLDNALVAFDYFNLEKLTKRMKSLQRLRRLLLKEPLVFSANGEEIEKLVQLFDMKVLEHLKCTDIKGRYCPKYYDGSSLGYLEDFGGFVLAGK